MKELSYAVRRMNEIQLTKKAAYRQARQSAWPCPQCGALTVYRQPKTAEVKCEEPGCGWVYQPWEQLAAIGERVAQMERQVAFLEKRVREVWQREYLPALEAEDRWLTESRQGDGR